MTWYQNTPDANAQLGVTSIRIGCSSAPDTCFDEILNAASSQDVSRIFLSIALDPNTAVSYAAQFSQWSTTHPILFSVGFDDLVSRMEHLQSDNGIAMPGQVVTDTINSAKSANPSLKFGVTMYEDQLDSPLLGDPNLPLSTRDAIDYVHLYVHYRMDGPNFATYVQQVQAIFPKAKIIAGAYAFDRIDYLPCQRGTTTPCTFQQEEDLFHQLFVAQLSMLNSGVVDQIEFFPGYFGIEAQWPVWFEPRTCTLSRLQECIANTQAMRQIVFQDLTNAFGTPGPLTALSPRPLVFPVQDLNATSGSSRITLHNPGTSPLLISSVAVSGAQRSDFAQQNTCGAQISAGSSCSIDVTFTPTGVGDRVAQLVVTDNARRSPHSMDLDGVGAQSTAPQVSLTPSSVNFSNQAVGSTSAATEVVLSNPGGSNLVISSISLAGTNQADFAQSNNCPGSLAIQASCTIAVKFAPSIQSNETAQVVIVDNAVGSPHKVSLSGVGTDPPMGEIQLSATVLMFAAQTINTTSVAQIVTLHNPGTAALVITDLSVSGTNSGDFTETSNCSSSVSAGGNCTITVIFKPSSSGLRTAQVLIADNANGSPQSVTLSGTGSAPLQPVASVSPGSVTFATQTINTTSAPAAVMLTNTGNASLAISNVSLGGPNAADFAAVSNCGASLAASAKCAINITFTPSVTGTRSAILQLADSAAGGAQTISLTGTGTAAGTASADFSISAAPLSAGVAAGQSAVFMLSVAGVGGFAQKVNFSCSGLPEAATCSFSQSSVVPGASSAVETTLTVVTQSRSELLPKTRSPFPPIAVWIPIGGSLAIALFLLVCLAWAQKLDVRLGAANFVLLMFLAGGAFGCGLASSPSSTGPPPAAHGTPAGTYTITVIAASGAISHSTTIALSVK